LNGRRQRAGLLPVIGAFRLVKGILLLALGFGLLKLMNRDLASHIQTWMQHWHVDPDNRYLRHFVSKLSHLNSRNITLVSAATLFYGGLFITEGVGLLMRKRWAEMLTVIATASFIPLEIYHLVRHFSPVKIVVIIINAAIVVYLIWRLRSDVSGRRSEV